MVAKRIIPCLDVKEGRTVKGVNFVGLQDVGDAVELGRRYASQGADELVYLDISATVEGRNTFTSLVERIAQNINIPFTVGGGISSIDDASRLLDVGADKISINSAAVRNPMLIDEIASKYGSQFVVLAVDANGALADFSVDTLKLTKSEKAALNALLQKTEYGSEVKISYTTDGSVITGITYSIPLPATYADMENIRIYVRDGAVFTSVDFEIERGYIVFTY